MTVGEWWCQLLSDADGVNSPKLVMESTHQVGGDSGAQTVTPNYKPAFCSGIFRILRLYPNRIIWLLRKNTWRPPIHTQPWHPSPPLSQWEPPGIEEIKQVKSFLIVWLTYMRRWVGIASIVWSNHMKVLASQHLMLQKIVWDERCSKSSAMSHCRSSFQFTMLGWS